jgi:L-ascorbate metabolism protein UlaG (beta-lactamase superfamily)
MEITWFGHSFFRLKDRGIAIVTDPYDESTGYPPVKVKADVVTISHNAPGHSNLKAVRGKPIVFNGPGEYEVKGVFITGVPSWHRRRKGVPPERTTIFIFEFDSITVAHLGDIGQVPSQEEIEELPAVDVLLIPVGGKETLDASKAAEVVSMLEPKVVIPMHYKTKYTELQLDGVEKFLKQMGKKDAKPAPSFKVKNRSDLPDETRVVLLECNVGT